MAMLILIADIASIPVFSASFVYPGLLFLYFGGVVWGLKECGN